jgi:hypothetical protein
MGQLSIFIRAGLVGVFLLACCIGQNPGETEIIDAGEQEKIDCLFGHEIAEGITIEECRNGGGIIMGCIPDKDGQKPPPGDRVNYTATNSSGAQSEWVRNLIRDANKTGVSKNNYTPRTFDCDDFAHHLERNLTAMGYNATFTIYWCYGGAGNPPASTHALTDVHAPDGTIVFIDATYDPPIIRDLDFDEDGKVEVSEGESLPINTPTDDNCEISVWSDRAAAVAGGVVMDY